MLIPAPHGAAQMGGCLSLPARVPTGCEALDNVGLLNPALGARGMLIPAPQGGSTNGGMLTCKPSPTKGQHKWGDAYPCPASPAPQGGSTNGKMLIPALQAQPHRQRKWGDAYPCPASKGAAQMGGCLSLTSKGAHGPSSA